MVEYGLLSLIVVVLALVGLTFHAWRGVKMEIVALLAIKADAAACITRVTAVELRQIEVEKVPAALKTHLDALGASVAAQEAKASSTAKFIAATEKNIMSINARITRSKGKQKRFDEGEERDPAAQAEGEDGESTDAMPPGAPPPFNGHPQASAIPSRFGVIAGKKVAHG